MGRCVGARIFVRSGPPLRCQGIFLRPPLPGHFPRNSLENPPGAAFGGAPGALRAPGRGTFPTKSENDHLPALPPARGKKAPGPRNAQWFWPGEFDSHLTRPPSNETAHRPPYRDGGGSPHPKYIFGNEFRMGGSSPPSEIHFPLGEGRNVFWMGGPTPKNKCIIHFLVGPPTPIRNTLI